MTAASDIFINSSNHEISKNYGFIGYETAASDYSAACSIATAAQAGQPVMTDILTRQLRIRGRVQGVGYRNYMAYKAGVLGIRGWVRNRGDGSVEAVVQGGAEAIEEIIACARRGPRAARVEAVEIGEASGEFTRFSLRQSE